jgi:cysteinyl-tRNA synthetase
LEGLDAAKNAVERIQGFCRRTENIKCKLQDTGTAIATRILRTRLEYKRGLDDDLNMPVSLASLHNLITNLNPVVEKGEISETDQHVILNYVREIDNVLGILKEDKQELADEEKQLVVEREKARKNRDFARADAIRNILRKRGVSVEDTPSGPRAIAIQKMIEKLKKEK